MRQLCNVAYAAIVEWKDEDERQKFDLELTRDPSLGPVSRGTNALLGLMGGPLGPPPPAPEPTADFDDVATEA